MKRLGLLAILVLCQHCMAEYVDVGAPPSIGAAMNSVMLARFGGAGAVETQRSVTIDPSQQNMILYSSLGSSTNTTSTSGSSTLTTTSTGSTSITPTATRSRGKKSSASCAPA